MIKLENTITPSFDQWSTILEALKNLNPCRCGGLPEVIVNNNEKKTIKCLECGRHMETEFMSLDWLVRMWNTENPLRTEIPLSRRVVGGEVSMRDYTGFFEVGEKILQNKNQFEIEKVIFNCPATIVFWKDGAKTIVKATDEPFDGEKGLAMAIAKKAYGNKGNYFNKLKKWLPKEDEESDKSEDPFEAFAEAMGKLARATNKKK